MAPQELVDAQCVAIATLLSQIATSDGAVAALRRGLEGADDAARDVLRAALAPPPAPPEELPPPPPEEPPAPPEEPDAGPPVSRLVTDGGELRTLSRTSSLSKDAAAAATMQRATYSPVDLAHLLRNKAELEIEDEATRYLDRLDTNGDGLVQAEEMGEFCTQDLDVKLQDAELDALHDLLDNSFDHTRVRDVCAFFESRDAVAGPGPSRLSVPRSNTVTTLAFSPDASRVGCGGIDSVLVVYDLSERVERRLLERRLPNMVGAISLGARGVASGCFGGRVDFVEDVLKAAPPPGEDPGEREPHAFSTSPKGCKASSATWELGQNVNAIALNEADGEVAVAAECELTIFSLATKEPKFVFPADGILWAVSMARSIVHVIELDGGASLRVTAKCVEQLQRVLQL